MTYPVKFRPHIEKVWRTKPDEATRQGRLRLDKNERIQPFSGPLWAEMLAGLTQESVQCYPEVLPLYKKLSTIHQWPVDGFLLTSGADGTIKHCFEAFVAPGDKVIYPRPTFAMVAVYSDLFGADKKEVHYNAELVLDMGDLYASIDDRTALVILANPNSPTGTLIDNAAISELLRKAAQHRVPVLIDEAYYGFGPATAEGLLKDHANLIITRTFSKLAGLAGMRIGYAMGHAETISLLARFRPMYEVNSVGISFAHTILDHWDVALEYGRQTVAGRNRFADFLRNFGFPVINTEANFLHVDLKDSKKTILEALESGNVLVRGMLSVPGYEHYTRFSLGPWESMLPVVTIIEQCMRGAK